MKDNDATIERYETMLREAAVEASQARVSQQQMELQMPQQMDMQNSINEQLDLGDILERMHNLLRGYVLTKQDDGSIKWVEPKEKDLVVLSDYGVSYIMQMLQAYLTKNTLLSNYDDKQILTKMEDFSTTLVDNIFMEYDKMFAEPTLEECKDELRRRVQSKVEIKKFALELSGVTVDDAREDLLEEGILKELEGRIETEMEVIKQQKRKNKLKRFESIVRMVQDTVHSAYQRAWKGQERTTARSHMHITETRGGMSLVPQERNIFGRLKRG